MAIFEMTQDNLTALSETSFDIEGIYERKDLQRHLKNNIAVLAPDLMVISEEYGDWIDSLRRIDLLCLDRVGNLVVVEIKRTNDGGHMELQAIRYAAMLSTMTFKQLVDAHIAYLIKELRPTETAEAEICAFLHLEESDEDTFGNEVRIILASPSFSKEITMAVLWLNDHDLDIRCIKLKPYRLEDKILLDVQQIIPLPEAADFQTQIRAKESAERVQKVERYDIRYHFWEGLLTYAKSKTQLHATRRPGKYHWIGGSTGKAGISLNYVIRRDDAQVELYIDSPDEEINSSRFKYLENNADAISTEFGEGLIWEDLPGRRARRVKFELQGGWKADRSEWKNMQHNMVDAMVRLENSFRPFINSVNM
ncbi:DUF4268 domain-containing protein [Herbaspirillum sp. RTI4]|uniref:DUF4268 domain-containing protein n=1 Tax=Herbaspirillum sp. RTI4 TaxID=3048640 RepID=UPI002AB38FE1|nr:DUF4268 domain-containing protein [Herbaspirillum sp. RTI4]MDY7579288.1 DUF4268 domain-containing protein [Herbaspirillum sp. RTI4]MEA9982787.1 DUF4268 domain-containing protein [Herbaspirillum sp. RTI4]